MKLLLIFLIVIFVNADIRYILNLISKIENRKYNFYKLKVPENVKTKIVFKKQNITKNITINVDVEAIFNKKVLIDNKWYKEGDVYKEKDGDMYKEFKIVKITRNYIFFKFNNKIYKIDIKPKIGL